MKILLPILICLLIFIGCGHKMCTSPPIPFTMIIMDGKDSDALALSYPGNYPRDSMAISWTDNSGAHIAALTFTNGYIMNGKSYWILGSQDVETQTLSGIKNFSLKRARNGNDAIYFDEQSKTANGCNYCEINAFKCNNTSLQPGKNFVYIANIK